MTDGRLVFLVPFFMRYWGREKGETTKQTRIYMNEVDAPRGVVSYIYIVRVYFTCAKLPQIVLFKYIYIYIYIYSE